MKNEALRIFLAVTALIMTAILVNPSFDEVEGPLAVNISRQEKSQSIAADQPTSPTRSIAKIQKKSDKKSIKEKEEKKRKSNRTFAFFWKR
jgi:hypothetical protein